MKPRIPLAYAGFLIIALVAVVGFAAFSPSQTSSDPSTTVVVTADTSTSARVASAILALRVSDAESRTATTSVAPATPEPTTTSTEAADDEALAATTTSESEVEVTTTAVTAAPPTSAAPPADTTPPALSISSPDDESTVDDRIVTFSGTTEPGASVTSGPYEADVDDDGSWTIRLVVAEGANGASFTATDDAGNSTTERIVVYYEAATTTTTTKAPSTTTTTAASGSEPTTTEPPAPKWSPLWPADPSGNQNVENWRSTVAKHFPAERIDCVLGIIQRESKGNPRAYNSASSAEGLMQHLSKYWHARAKGAGFIDGDGLVATPYNGEANIAAGAWLASYYDRTTGDWWSPWKSSSGEFTAFYGSCQSPDPS